VGSEYGGGMINNFFLLEWHWFYLVPVRIAGGGGGSGFSGGDANSAWYAKGGFMLGVPIHFGNLDRNAIRIGAGLSGGFLHNASHFSIYGNYDRWVNESYGPFIDAEAYYLYRWSEHMALTVGFQGTFVVRYEQNNYYSVGGPNNIYGGAVGMQF
jgi:hypothetical protein